MEIEIVVGTYDCFVKGYSFNLASAEKQITPKFHEKSHAGCVKAISCGGRYLASGSTDETIKLYDLTTHTEIGSLVQHEGTITDLIFFNDSHLLSASEDHTICIWRCGGSWECLHVLKGHKERINSVSIHPSGKLALSVAQDKNLRMWNLLTGRLSYVCNLKQAASLVVWSPVGDQYLLVYRDVMSVCDVQTGRTTRDIAIGNHINSVVYVKDKVAAVASEQSAISLMSLVTGKCLHKLEGHTNRVKALSLTPGNSFLISASSDGSIRAWKLMDNLSECCCVCQVDTRSRLVCMALSCPKLPAASSTHDSKAAAGVTTKKSNKKRRHDHRNTDTEETGTAKKKSKLN